MSIKNVKTTWDVAVRLSAVPNNSVGALRSKIAAMENRRLDDSHNLWSNLPLFYSFPDRHLASVESKVSKLASQLDRFPFHITSRAFVTKPVKQLSRVKLSTECPQLFVAHAFLSRELRRFMQHTKVRSFTRPKIEWDSASGYKPSFDINNNPSASASYWNPNVSVSYWDPSVSVSHWIPHNNAIRIREELTEQYPEEGKILSTDTAVGLVLQQRLKWWNDSRKTMQYNRGAEIFYPFQPNTTDSTEISPQDINIPSSLDTKTHDDNTTAV